MQYFWESHWFAYTKPQFPTFKGRHFFSTAKLFRCGNYQHFIKIRHLPAFCGGNGEYYPRNETMGWGFGLQEYQIVLTKIILNLSKVGIGGACAIPTLDTPRTEAHFYTHRYERIG